MHIMAHQHQHSRNARARVRESSLGTKRVARWHNLWREQVDMTLIEPGAGDEQDNQSSSAPLRAQAHEADEHGADAMHGVVGEMALRARCLTV